MFRYWRAQRQLVLTLNCGSSTIKYKLLDMRTEAVKRQGQIDKVTDYETSMKSILTEISPFISETPLHCVGHRVVHGGDRFVQPTRLTDVVLTELRKLSALAPLHNPVNLLGIDLARKFLPDSVPHVAVFDTAFHATIPEFASLYALPYEVSKQHHIKRYGFHGISHKYVSQEAARLLDRPHSNFIVAHLGSGCSATAVKASLSVETTMGFTPMEGLIMATRAGSIDPGVESYLCREAGMSVQEVTNMLNKKSGLLGISGFSNDMRVLIAATKGLGDFTEDQRRRARLAIDMFVYRLAKHIGSLMPALESRLDALVFTGGVGENSPLIRKLVIDRLKFLGLYLHDGRNEVHGRGTNGEITEDDSPLAALVVPTDEELQIAREAVEFLC
jgi:acetate kinase